MQPIEARLTQNFIKALADAAIGSGGRVEHFPGVTCVRSPIPVTPFNSAFVIERAGVEPDSLNKIRGFFDGLQSDWRFVFPPAIAEVFWDIPKHLAVARWGRDPEMILSSQSASLRPTPSELEIHPVRDVDELLTWTRTNSLGFEAPDPNFFDALARPENLEMKGLTWYIGTYSGKPVATSTLCISDAVAGIYDVCTLPEFRGRGFGSAMTAIAMKEGFSKGCDLAALQSSPVGVPVYFKMGFRYVFDYLCWVVSHRTHGSKN